MEMIERDNQRETPLELHNATVTDFANDMWSSIYSGVGNEVAGITRKLVWNSIRVPVSELSVRNNLDRKLEHYEF
jgi:hypothetical protein